MLIKTFIFKLVKTTDINIIFLRQQLSIKIERNFRIYYFYGNSKLCFGVFSVLAEPH